MRHSNHPHRPGRLLILSALGLLVAACGGAASPTPGATAPATVQASAGPTGAASSPGLSGPQTAKSSPTETPTTSTGPTESPAPEPSGGTTSGDIPDNAVFLTYKGTGPAFSIQYVEGWQVTPQPDGVVIRDKDSSETVALVAPQADVPGYVTSTDLPALGGQAGFALVKRDTVKVGGSTYVHLVFNQKSPPDSVTGKQVPQTVDRYYVPGPGGLAIVSLATPNGVDNVDAFRQMIESFKWS